MSESANTTSRLERDPTGQYLDEIARTPLLDAEQEVELSKTIEAGLYAEQLLAEGRVGRRKGGAPLSANQEELDWLAEEGKKAVDQFTTANLRLVVSIARKYGRAQMPMLDLIQEGNTGLIRAVEKFDYTKGYKFSTYATWWIRQAVTRGIAQQALIVRLPVHVVEELNQVGGARRTLERQLGRDPEPEEIAAELTMKVSRVVDLIKWGRDHVSLDTPVSEDGDTTLGDLMAEELSPGPETTLLDKSNRDELEQLINQLEEREADIIRARYGLLDGRQHKLEEVALRHGLSAERVRQLQRESVENLKILAAGGTIRTRGIQEPKDKPVEAYLPGKPRYSAVPLEHRSLIKSLVNDESFSGQEHGLSEEQAVVIKSYMKKGTIAEVAKHGFTPLKIKSLVSHAVKKLVEIGPETAEASE